MKSRGNSKHAFTIIELLVSITIILILASLLFACGASAKKSALRAVSLSNVSQIGHAMLIYAGEHNERLPVECNLMEGYWMRPIGLHQGKSPDLKDPEFRPYSQWPYSSQLVGYGVNGCLGNVLNQVSSAGSVVLLGTSAELRVTVGTYSEDYTGILLHAPDSVGADIDRQYGVKIDAPNGFGSTRYFGKGLYFFVDGHARAYEPTRFYYLETRIPCQLDPLAKSHGSPDSPTFLVN